MIYKHEHLTKKLRASGRAAQAVILSMRTEGSSTSIRAIGAADDDLTTQWSDVKMDLRVEPVGEAPFEVSVRTRLSTFKYKGDRIPVLYDPDDHDKVVVDYETDVQQEMAKIPDPRAAASAPATPTPTSAVDTLERLADLHDRGVLSDAEFATEKAKVFAG